MYHVITQLSTSVPHEIALKIFEFTQLGLPVSCLAAVIGPLKLNSIEKNWLWDIVWPWAVRCGQNDQGGIMCAYWEEMWDWSLDEVREKIGVWAIPQVIL